MPLSVASLASGPRAAPSCALLERQACRGLAERRSLVAQPRRTHVRVQANSGDLDKKWAEFKKRSGIKMPVVEQQNVATEAPRFSRSRGGWNDGPTADTVRRQESRVLNLWTQERLMQLAAGGTMALVLVLLFAAGGPPSDPRCTLPWC